LPFGQQMIFKRRIVGSFVDVVFTEVIWVAGDLVRVAIVRVRL
jgi:hypothetical protein